MNPQSTMLLNREDVRSLLSFDDLVRAMEWVFRRYAGGQTLDTGLLHLEAVDGDFHIKAGGIRGRHGSPDYFGAKINGSFFNNPATNGMPSIQGCILLADAATGYPLALMDSVEITGQRTAATTAVAALNLARKDSQVLTVVGAGRQARRHLEGLAQVLRIENAFIIARDPGKAKQLAEEVSQSSGVCVKAANDARSALWASDIVVTCTPSREPIIRAGDIQPGTFVACVGADGPGKNEIDPALFERAMVVVDLLKQCVRVGELQHPLKAGLLKEEQVAELGDIVAGSRPGRISDNETVIFDSTGTALQDVAAASLAFEKAIATGRGTSFNLFR